MHTESRHTFFRLVTAALLLLVMCMVCVQSVDAKKKKSKYDLKREHPSYLPLIEPDPITRKAAPDNHPKALQKPDLAGIGHGAVGNPLHGIDVSHYQGRINWQEVARDPQVGYVYMKMTEGSNMIDNTYEYNNREARRAGLKVGVYHFFRANVTAEAQFANFMSVFKKQNQDLIPIVDVELSNGVRDGVFVSRLEKLLDLITKEIGRKPMIYTGKHYYKKYCAYNSKLRSYPYMIASYTFTPPTLERGDEYMMWQFTSQGTVRGIKGDVDRSKFMGRHTIHEIMF